MLILVEGLVMCFLILGINTKEEEVRIIEKKKLYQL